MNVLQALFCNQYDELVRTGRDGNKARKNGLILCAVCITLNIFTFFAIFYLSSPAVINYLEDASVILKVRPLESFFSRLYLGYCCWYSVTALAQKNILITSFQNSMNLVKRIKKELTAKQWSIALEVSSFFWLLHYLRSFSLQAVES